MKYKKLIPFVLIFLCMILLICFENQFQSMQNSLILESNNLFSPHHILADEAINSVWKKSKISSDEFNLFGLIEKNSANTIMAFYTTNYSNFKPPIISDNCFSTTDSNEAIVGKNIKVTLENGEEYFTYGSTKYKVISRFGITENSPLKNLVLINDSSFLEQPNIPLVFDGKEISKIKWLNGELMENKGVQRWFNIRFISKWIKFTTYIVVILGVVLNSYFFVNATKDVFKLKIEIGIAIRAIIKSDLITLTFITALTVIIARFIVYILSIDFWSFENIISYIISYISIVLVYALLVINKVIREVH